MHLIVHHVSEFQHVDNTYGCGLVKLFTCSAIVEVGASEFRKACLCHPLVNLFIGCSVKNRGCEFNTELLSGPTENGFIDLTKVHPGRYTQRVEHDVNRGSVFEIWHVLIADNLCHDTLVSVTTSHL